MFGMSPFETLIIAFLFITSFDCVLAYFCSTNALKILKEKKSISQAINKLRIYDQYILSKANIIVAIVYFIISYFFISSLTTSIYVVLFSISLAFIITLLTTFASRLCYCYACNVLLETKLNEWECLKENFKSLTITYLPFFIFSIFIPSLLTLDVEIHIKIVCLGIFLFSFIVLWLLSTPKIMVITLGARPIENPLLKHRLDKLLEVHKIKKYRLFSWDTSKSKESNAMVSGILTHYIFISTSLLNDITLPELESILTHEIGHIKNKHLIKLMSNKVLMLILVASLLILPYIINASNFQLIVAYVFIAILFIMSLVYGLSLERIFENEADVYADKYSDTEVYVSALKKISRYEDIEIEVSRIDDFFQSHPSFKDRVLKMKENL